MSRLKELNYTWHVQWDSKLQGYYARTCLYLGMHDGKPKYKPLLLHSFVMNAEEGEYIDHKNHNTLDNRKENLNKDIQQKNLFNRKGKNKNNTSGYRNVQWDKSINKWTVRLQIDRKSELLGTFDNVHEAGSFARDMREKYYGELATKG